MHIEYVTAWVMLGALVGYVLLGGADFGAGVWDMLASGPRKKEQRELLAHAIGPVWEANHVWLIIVVVMLFTCFPAAFAGAMTALHFPVTFMLIGIVLRGASFTFRAYTGGGDRSVRLWGRVFSIASVVTPLLLGVTLGTASSGALEWRDGVYVSGFFEPWLRVFPWSVGVLTLAIFAYLAAVYVCAETKGALREDFRRKALAAGIIVGVAAAGAYVCSRSGAPVLSQRLIGSAWSWPLQIAAGVAAVGGVVSLWRRQFMRARFLVAAQMVFIVVGYGAALFPYLVVPEFTLENSSAPRETHRLVLAAIVAGSVILLPSLFYLLRVFKGPRAFAVWDPR